MKENRERIMDKYLSFIIGGLAFLMIIVVVLGFSIFYNQYEKTIVKNQETKTYDYYFAMIQNDENKSYWDAVYEGAREKGGEYNAFVEKFENREKIGFSMEEQIKIAIASGVDGIIIEGEDKNSIKKEVNKAVESQIPVVTVNQDISGSLRVSYVGMSWYETGQMFGNLVCEIIQKKNDNQDNELQKVVVFTDGTSENNEQNLLLSGIRTVLSNRQEGKVVSLDTVVVNHEGAFSEEEFIRDYFLKQREESVVYVCLNEMYTNCCVQAVVDYNQVGIANIIGYYASEETLDGFDKGIIDAVVTVDTKQMGEYCVQALMEYIEYGYVSDYFAVDSQVLQN